MGQDYDLVIIGSGTAAQTVARRVREAKWRVAVIDERPFGGTCQLRGCDPKKVLVGATEPLAAARRLRGKGVAGGLRIDWAELMAFKRRFTNPVPEQQAERDADSGIDEYHGHARFTGRNAVAVGGETLQGRFILIATGARPVPLKIPGEEHVVTSDDFLDLAALPRRIAFVGGGYVAAELAHIAARAGAEVTVLQRGPRLLPPFDADLVRWLMDGFRELGIDVRVAATVDRVERNGAERVVHASMAGRPATVAADLVVHAAGRAPDFAALDPAAAGIDMDNGRLRLNEFLQSVSNPSIYAAGDAAQHGPPLTPVAGLDGRAVAANLLQGNRERPNYAGVPSAVFTVPPLARVGLGDAEAKAQGLNVRVKSSRTADWYSARHVGETVAGFKTVIENGSGRILGAHLLGPHADEVINLFALAIRHGLTAGQLADTVFAYPTGGSDIAYML